MNMIKTLSIMIGLVLVLFMVPAVIAQGDKLLITDLDVKVGSKTDKNIEDKDDGYTIDQPAAPGDKVEFSIEVKNNFTNEEDLEIEDIAVTVTIEAIDDEGDDDLEEEAKEFDLKDGKDKKVTVEFEVPIEVDEDTYVVLIEIEGDDENGTTHTLDKTLELEVEKESHEVRFLRNSLTPSEIKCARTVQLSTGIINTGSNDEDDAVLEVSNVELGVSFRETFDLVEDPFDDENEFRKTFTFSVPEDVAEGIYTVQSKVTYDEGDEIQTETADLVVTKCEIFEEEPEVECETDNDCKRTEICDNGECVEEEVVVVQPPVTETPDVTGGVTAADIVSTPTLPETEEKSFFETSGFLITLVIGEVLLLIVAILIIVAVFKKRG